MEYFIIYLLIGGIIVLWLYDWKVNNYFLVPILICFLWPVVFYYAYQAVKAQVKKPGSTGGDKDPTSGDPGQT